MGKSVTRKSLLPAGSRWLIVDEGSQPARSVQGVEKSRKEEKNV